MHLNLVKECAKLQTNECRYGGNVCWFKHGDENTHEESLENKIKDMTFEDITEESVFQNVWKTTQIK